MKIRELFKKDIKEQKLSFQGWVISNRGNSKIRFLTINDGSDFRNLQIVVKKVDASIEQIKIGSAIEINGTLKFTPEAKQAFEIIAQKVKVVSQVENDYPLQKQGMSYEFLRTIPHLRHRTNIFRAVMNIRSTLFFEINNFFQERNFLNMAAPIITSNDGEGAGEMFEIDSPSKNFFGKKQAFLGVTGQLYAEAYAIGFTNVYTFAPTFRAENSHTQKHVAEFWMLEPEMAFASKEDGINLAEDLLKQVIKKTISKHPEEFAFLTKWGDENLLKRLKLFLKQKLQKITYAEAIKILAENKKEFEEQNIHFGLDLNTEHERYLVEKVFKAPVAITDFPKEIKAFYMKENDDHKTVAAFDILVPGIGELVGGSEREENYDKLVKRLKELKISQKELDWYLDLRRFGKGKSTGFGLGFERLIMYVTGMENIRDTIPFPRTPNNLKI